MPMSEINFINSLYPKGQETPRSGNRLSRNLKKLSILFAAFATIVLIVSFGPSLWYLIQGGAGQNSKVLGSYSNTEFGDLTQENQEEVIYQPRLDTSLSKENRIIMPSVKIDTIVHEATSEDYEEALKKGVWRVSDFGDPYSRSKPLILAAHRFGYLKWSIPYRLKNSS